MHDKAAFVIAISGAELVARDDPEGALILIMGTDVPIQHLAEAALKVFALVMSGDNASSRFDEMRTVTHQLAAEAGADDRQVVLNQEVIGAAQAIEQGDLNRARVITSTSMFMLIDFAHVAVSLTGQAVAGWVGRDRAPEVFAALRSDYGVQHGAA